MIKAEHQGFQFSIIIITESEMCIFLYKGPNLKAMSVIYHSAPASVFLLSNV